MVSFNGVNETVVKHSESLFVSLSYAVFVRVLGLELSSKTCLLSSLSRLLDSFCLLLILLTNGSVISLYQMLNIF